MTESECRTQKLRIDRSLKAAGWPPTPFHNGRPIEGDGRAAAIEEYETASGPASYLLTDAGALLAGAEAKKLSLGPRNALTQAIRSAEGLHESPFDHDGRWVPFGYSTNGEKIFFQDSRREDSYSRLVSAFHTPSALPEYLNRDDEAALDWFRAHANDHPRLPTYQKKAAAVSYLQRKIEDQAG